MTAKTIYDGLELRRYSWIFIALYHYLFVGTFGIQCLMKQNICFIHVGARTVIIIVAKCYHDVTEDGDPQILACYNYQISLIRVHEQNVHPS